MVLRSMVIYVALLWCIGHKKTQIEVKTLQLTYMSRNHKRTVEFAIMPYINIGAR